MADFSIISETPGLGASPDQLAQLYNRYHFIAQRAAGKDVLEVACGAGFGLGYLARVARSVRGGDYDDTMVRIAREHYGDRIAVDKMDAQILPFPENSFDIVAILEALYYVPDAERFFAEAARVLRPGGELIVITANREWKLFNPSPFSSHYHTASEFFSTLPAHGFSVEVFKTWHDDRAGFKASLFAFIRRIAVSWNLIPKNKWGKEKIKKLLYGTLTPLPAEVSDDMAPLHPLYPVTPGEVVSDYTILYVVATKRP